MRNGLIRETDQNTLRPPTERQLLGTLMDALRVRLPETWALTLETEVGPDEKATADGWLKIQAPDRVQGLIAVEVKRKLYVTSADIKLISARAGEQTPLGAGLLLLAPYLSPRARTLLNEARLNYADSTGNLLLRLDRPALYIEGIGAQENPWYTHQPLRSLKGPTAGRAVRALCDFHPPFGIRELATKTQTPAPIVSRVARLLEQEALLERSERGAVLAVSVMSVIKRWARDYSMIRSNRMELCLEPRGLDALVEKLGTAGDTYVVTGSLAAAQLAPYAPPRLAAVYVPDIERAKAELRLRAVERGANVLLLEPFDRVVFERTQLRAGITYAAPTQVAADLLTGPGRSPEEGYELLRWMEGHRDDWQRP